MHTENIIEYSNARCIQKISIEHSSVRWKQYERMEHSDIRTLMQDAYLKISVEHSGEKKRFNIQREKKDGPLKLKLM